MRRYRLILPIFSGFVFITAVKLTEKGRGRRQVQARRAGSGKCLVQWFLAISKLPVAPVRTRVAVDFFDLLWNVRHTCFQCGPISLPGRDRAGMLDPSETCPIHVHLRDPGYTCKPRRSAALHSHTWLPATQTGLVSQ